MSQITVRRALRELRHGGLVTSRHGLGWYAQDGAPQHAETTEVAVILPDLDWLCARLVRHLAEDLVGSGVYLRLTFTDGDGDAGPAPWRRPAPWAPPPCWPSPPETSPSLAERYARHTGEGNPPSSSWCARWRTHTLPPSFGMSRRPSPWLPATCWTSGIGGWPTSAETPPPSRGRSATGALPPPSGIAALSCRWTG